MGQERDGRRRGRQTRPPSRVEGRPPLRRRPPRVRRRPPTRWRCRSLVRGSRDRGSRRGPRLRRVELEAPGRGEVPSPIGSMHSLPPRSPRRSVDRASWWIPGPPRSAPDRGPGDRRRRRSAPRSGGASPRPSPSPSSPTPAPSTTLRRGSGRSCPPPIRRGPPTWTAPPRPTRPPSGDRACRRTARGAGSARTPPPL